MVVCVVIRFQQDLSDLIPVGSLVVQEARASELPKNKMKHRNALGIADLTIIDIEEAIAPPHCKQISYISTKFNPAILNIHMDSLDHVNPDSPLPDILHDQCPSGQNKAEATASRTYLDWEAAGCQQRTDRFHIPLSVKIPAEAFKKAPGSGYIHCKWISYIPINPPCLRLI